MEVEVHNSEKCPTPSKFHKEARIRGIFKKKLVEESSTTETSSTKTRRRSLPLPNENFLERPEINLVL